MGEHGRVELAARHVGGTTRLVRCSSSGLLAARATPWGVLLVSQGAQLIGDDRIEVDIDIGPGAELSIGSLGSTIARRGPSLGAANAGEITSEAITTVRARVGEGASLDWHPEPSIAAAGSRHRSRGSVELAAGASLRWREEAVLGRLGEQASGTLWSVLECRYDGKALLVSEIGLGPAAVGWERPSVLAAARALCCVVLAGPGAGDRVPGAGDCGPGAGDRGPGAGRSFTSEEGGARGALLRLAGPGVEVLAIGSELAGCRNVASALLETIPPRPRGFFPGQELA